MCDGAGDQTQGLTRVRQEPVPRVPLSHILSLQITVWTYGLSNLYLLNFFSRHMLFSTHLFVINFYLNGIVVLGYSFFLFLSFLPFSCPLSFFLFSSSFCFEFVSWPYIWLIFTDGEHAFCRHWISVFYVCMLEWLVKYIIQIL